MRSLLGYQRYVGCGCVLEQWSRVASDMVVADSQVSATNRQVFQLLNDPDAAPPGDFKFDPLGFSATGSSEMKRDMAEKEVILMFWGLWGGRSVWTNGARRFVSARRRFVSDRAASANDHPTNHFASSPPVSACQRSHRDACFLWHRHPVCVDWGRIPIYVQRRG